MNLYEITSDYQSILAAIECGEIPEEQVDDILEQMEGEWETKAQAVAAFVLNLRADVAAMEAAIKRMKERMTATEKKADRLAEYLQQQMSRAGKTKLATPEFTAVIRKNPGRVVIDDESLVPGNLMTTPKPAAPRPNLKAIKSYIEESPDCPWAHIEQSERLELK